MVAETDKALYCVALEDTECFVMSLTQRFTRIEKAPKRAVLDADSTTVTSALYAPVSRVTSSRIGFKLDLHF